MRLRLLRLAARLAPATTPAGALPARPRLLLVRPDHLGDLLLTLPAIAGLRAALPDAHLTLLGGPWSAGVLRGYPHLDAVETCPFPGFDRRPSAERANPYRLLLSTARRLRRERFDAALVFRPDAWWAAWLCQVAMIPRRHGFQVPEVGPFLTSAVPPVPHEHQTDEARRLAAAAIGRPVPAGDCRVYPSRADEQRATEVFAATRRARAIAVHAGSGAPVKRWDDAACVQAADALARDLGAEILYTAGPAEQALAARLAGWSREPARVVAGLAPLELAAVLARCALALGPDSGVLHLAAAVGTPTVRLYGPADARRFGPVPNGSPAAVVRSGLACAPCGRLDFSPAELPYHRCLLEVPAEQVVAEARALLGRG